jgi:hypothetical protein
MTSKTRYFVIASLLVMTVGLATGLVAYYGDLGTSAFANQGGPDELQLVPADASFVAFARVADLMATPAGQKVRAILPFKSDDPQGLQNQTGINIDTDIDRLVLSLVTPKEGTEAKGRALVIARGRFDAVKIEAFMRGHGAHVETYKDHRLITAAANPPATESFSAVLIEPGLIAAGSTTLVRGAVDLQTGGANVTTNDSLMQRIRQVETGQAWAVGRFDAFARGAHLPDTMSQSIPAITWVSASATVDNDVSGVVTAETRDEASANSVRDLVRGIVALGRLQTASHPEVQALFQSLELAGTGTTVTLSFDVPSQLFDLLGQMASEHLGARRQPQ